MQKLVDSNSSILFFLIAGALEAAEEISRLVAIVVTGQEDVHVHLIELQ